MGLGGEERRSPSTRGLDHQIRCASFSPTEDVLFVGDRLGTIRWWDPLASAEVGSIQAGSSTITDIEFRPDKRGFVTLDSDSVIRLWPLPAHFKASAPHTPGGFTSTGPSLNLEKDPISTALPGCSSTSGTNRSSR